MLVSRSCGVFSVQCKSGHWEPGDKINTGRGM